MDGVYGELIRDLGRDCGSQMACGMFVSPIQAGVVAEESRPSNSYCLGYSVHIVDWRNDSLLAFEPVCFKYLWEYVNASREKF